MVRPVLSEKTKADRAARIVSEATEMFARYGYAKTTLQDVADQCRLSPAHLYNYFPNKLALAAAVVERLSLSLLAQVQSKVDQAASPQDTSQGAARGALAQVETFVLTELETSWQLLNDNPALVSVLDRVGREAPETANELLRKVRTSLAAVIQTGISRGEIEAVSAEHAAEMVQVATIKFRFPQWSNDLPLPRLKQEAEGVLVYLTRGLAATR